MHRRLLGRLPRTYLVSTGFGSHFTCLGHFGKDVEVAGRPLGTTRAKKVLLAIPSWEKGDALAWYKGRALLIAQHN